MRCTVDRRRSVPPRRSSLDGGRRLFVRLARHNQLISDCLFDATCKFKQPAARKWTCLRLFLGRKFGESSERRRRNRHRNRWNRHSTTGRSGSWPSSLAGSDCCIGRNEWHFHFFCFRRLVLFHKFVERSRLCDIHRLIISKPGLEQLPLLNWPAARKQLDDEWGRNFGRTECRCRGQPPPPDRRSVVKKNHKLSLDRALWRWDEAEAFHAERGCALIIGGIK